MVKKCKKIVNNKFKDSDADGLTDAQEINLGTNPKKADSDDDGVNDYEEVNLYGTDPLNSDTDGDGVKDGAEIKRGRNPRGPGKLKDLFIPHAGNDFKPKALEPYRLLFYALSSIFLKTVLIGAVLILPIEAWLTPDILVEQSKKIISLTNLIRQNLNLAALTESALLNQAAYNKAEDMLVNQYFAHAGPDNRTLGGWLKQIKYNFAVAGENLAMGFTSPEDVVNGWVRSQTHYQNMIDPDFTEIGVGMTSGLFEKVETILVAQYFALPTIEPAKAAELVKTAVKPVAAASTTAPLAASSALLSQKVQEAPVAEMATPATTTPATVLVAAPEPPRIDLERSKLYLDQPQGQNQNIVRAEVYLSADAVKAQVAFSNYFIDLRPAGDEAGSSAALATSKWTGQTMIFNESQEQIFNPVVLASVTAENQAGLKATADLEWDQIRPLSTTRLQQYYFVRQNQSPLIKPLFNVTSIFYKIILLVALIALALNIFIEIKKQYPRLILSTLGLIALLAALIII